MEIVMASAQITHRKLVLVALLALFCSAGLAPQARADEYRRHDHEFREHEFRDQRFLDSRYHHDHYYPPRGHEFRVLPPGYFVRVYGGNRFYFSEGVWYRPFAGGFIVADPPIGIAIPLRPAYYTQVWVGGIPYYYANNVYYMQRPEGYVVVPPPSGTVVTAPPPGNGGVNELGPVGGIALPPAAGTVNSPPASVAATQSDANRLFLYPRQGQSAEQQNRDRSECNSWATNQANPANQADFQRALSACLDGRGYTVK
jgi:hypothetical protein